MSKQKNFRRVKPRYAPFGTVPPDFADRFRVDADPAGNRQERRRAKKLGITLDPGRIAPGEETEETEEMRDEDQA